MTTQATTEPKRQPTKAEVDQQLDDALKGTFPASDPVAVGEVTSDEPDRPADRRAPKIDKALVDKLAGEVANKRRKSAAKRM